MHRRIMANASENADTKRRRFHGPVMRAGLKVFLPTDWYDAAKKDNAVQLALNAIADPKVDLDKNEWPCSIKGAVWVLQQHSDANVYTLCIGPSRTGGTWL